MTDGPTDGTMNRPTDGQNIPSQRHARTHLKVFTVPNGDLHIFVARCSVVQNSHESRGIGPLTRLFTRSLALLAHSLTTQCLLSFTTLIRFKIKLFRTIVLRLLGNGPSMLGGVKAGVVCGLNLNAIINA